MTKKYKLDIKDVLYNLDINNRDFYSSLDDEQKKAVEMWVIMRFMSSTTNNTERSIILTNRLVNHEFNLLRNHPELQWKLLSIVGSGTKAFHPWINPPKRKTKNKRQEVISKIYKGLSKKDIDTLDKIITDQELIELALEYGIEDMLEGL